MPLDEETKTEVIRKDRERREAAKVLDSLLQDDEFREMFVRKIASAFPFRSPHKATCALASIPDGLPPPQSLFRHPA